MIAFPFLLAGGADSDIVLDLIEKVREPGKEIHYVWFNTGLEYQATKDHIKELEEKYGVTIEEHKPIKSIPLSVKEFGVPFLSKYVSEMMERLQAHDFKWENEPFDILLQRYPKCKSALKWWCNEHEYTDKIKSYDIGYNKYLKEFILLNPPTFKISNACCDYAKKFVGKKVNAELNVDLNCVGVTSLIDAGCRFANGTVPEFLSYPNDMDSLDFAKLFIKTVEDGLAKSKLDLTSTPTSKIPQAKIPVALTVPEEKPVQKTPADIDEVADAVEETTANAEPETDDVFSDTTNDVEELRATIKETVKTVSADKKAEAVKFIKENGGKVDALGEAECLKVLEILS